MAWGSSLASAHADFTLDDSQFQQRSGAVINSMQQMGQRMEKVARVARLMLVGATAGLGYFVKQASDAQEVTSKFHAVFRDEAHGAQEFADMLAQALGRSRYELMEFLGSLQDTFVPLGFTREHSARLAKQLTELTLDLASFNNQAEATTLRDLQSAIVGNHETMRKYGVIITQAALDQQLLNSGQAKGAKDATEQQKVLARLAIIMQSTTDAQGDAARTSDQFANQLRGLRGQAKDAGIAFGSIFIPALTRHVVALRELAPRLQAYLAQNKAAVQANIEFGLGIAVLLIVGPKLIAFYVGARTALLGWVAAMSVGALGTAAFIQPLLLLVGIGLAMWLRNAREEALLLAEAERDLAAATKDLATAQTNLAAADAPSEEIKARLDVVKMRTARIQAMRAELTAPGTSDKRFDELQYRLLQNEREARRRDTHMLKMAITAEEQRLRAGMLTWEGDKSETGLRNQLKYAEELRDLLVAIERSGVELGDVYTVDLERVTALSQTIALLRQALGLAEEKTGVEQQDARLIQKKLDLARQLNLIEAKGDDRRRLRLRHEMEDMLKQANALGILTQAMEARIRAAYQQEMADIGAGGASQSGRGQASFVAAGQMWRDIQTQMTGAKDTTQQRIADSNEKIEKVLADIGKKFNVPMLEIIRQLIQGIGGYARLA